MAISQGVKQGVISEISYHGECTLPKHVFEFGIGQSLSNDSDMKVACQTVVDGVDEITGYTIDWVTLGITFYGPVTYTPPEVYGVYHARKN